MTIQTHSLALSETTSDAFQTEQVLTIAGGHFVHDTFSAFLAPLLPLLIDKLSLSLTLAGSLTAFLQAPALLQPFIGYLADKKISLRYFVIFAPAITATLMSALGLAPNYLSLTILLLAAGVSVAAFHAPAPAMISHVAGRQVGKGMSFFMAAGELGRTVGPLLAVWAASLWGLEGMYRLLIPAWATTAILYWRLQRVTTRPAGRQDIQAALPALRSLFLPLLIIIVLRGFLIAALSVFLPTFMDQQGANLFIAGGSLALYELAGVGGALASGTLSDRLGRRPVLLVAMAASSVLALAFLYLRGWLLAPILLLLGFTSLSTQPVMMAMVQDRFPQHRAVANGLFLSMVFLAQMVSVVLIGAVGDIFGLRIAFLGSALILLLALPAVMALPR